MSVACGDKHTVAVTGDGSVYSWGAGRKGALGHGSTENVGQPRKIEGLTNAVRVDCGKDHTVVLDSDGRLHSFGENTFGQLGLNIDSMRESAPKKIYKSMSQGKVVDFSCGDEHNAYVD